MGISCHFCGKEVTSDNSKKQPTKTIYSCKRCGPVHLTEEAAEDFESKRYSANDKMTISITLRNDWERKGKPIDGSRQLTVDDLDRIVSQFRPLDPIEKMDNALIELDKSTSYVGQIITVEIMDDYPLYYCIEAPELRAVLLLLSHEGFILDKFPPNPHTGLSITARGYQRLREIQKSNRESRNCFVAMWFTPEMDDVFRKAIKPAIEFIEPGETACRYEAVKIDNVEHLNDINDEIIAQIRRSRFMVCDLTGYRGGVYFEAGFAYGLGMEVIYTCRKDWTKEEILKDHSGNPVKTLFDNNGRQIAFKKEGVHFDLAHRNRIEWEFDKLEEFRIKLENRIKAAIF